MDHDSKLAFVANPLDRAGDHRKDPDWCRSFLASMDLGIVQVDGDKVKMSGTALSLDGMLSADEAVILGRDLGGRPFAAQATMADDTFRDLRSLMLEGILPPDVLSVLAQARSLVHWHQTHRFCSACGKPSTMVDGGYRRHCETCSADHFPRTDPVVIMAVHRPGFILMGRQSFWRPGMYSTLAGFMEPGETIEQAARREIFEEAGILVGTVSYVASQPWPFPASLMIGLIGEAKSEKITMDATELEDVRWFSHDEIRQMLAGTHHEGLFCPHPHAIAHQLVCAALQSA